TAAMLDSLKHVCSDFLLTDARDSINWSLDKEGFYVKSFWLGSFDQGNKKWCLESLVRADSGKGEQIAHHLRNLEYQDYLMGPGMTLHNDFRTSVYRKKKKCL
ncbi:hypothetical protein ACJX0J_029562, partial [Zea mays]